MMESIGKLRELCAKWRKTSITPGRNSAADEVDAIADEIEREIAERYMELPPMPEPGQHAMDYIRAELDKRGIDWHRWTKGNVETCWFVENAEIGNFHVKASVSKDRRCGPVHYKGMMADPRAVILAAFGQIPATEQPRTIEDVLDELADEIIRQGHQAGLTAPGIIAKYADELRSMGVGE